MTRGYLPLLVPDMNLKSLALSKELRHSLVIILILSFVFGFNDKRETFAFSLWLSNFVHVFVLVAVTVFVHVVAAKLAANKLGQDAEISLLSFKTKRFGSVPFSTILSMVLMLISRGMLYFTAVSTIIVKKSPRLSKGFYLNESKEALIYFWALVSNIILIIIFNFLDIKTGVLINSYFLFWNLLPIPGFIGSKIFFHNKTLYILFLIFALLFLLLFNKVNLILLIIMLIAAAFLVMILWILKKEYKP